MFDVIRRFFGDFRPADLVASGLELLFIVTILWLELPGVFHKHSVRKRLKMIYGMMSNAQRIESEALAAGTNDVDVNGWIDSVKVWIAETDKRLTKHSIAAHISFNTHQYAAAINFPGGTGVSGARDWFRELRVRIVALHYHTPPANGSLGTAISSTGSAVNFTPAFTHGSISNIQVGSNLTIAGTETCTATASAASGIVTYTTSSCLNSSGSSVEMRIPPSAVVTVTNSSPSSFDGTGMPVQSSNYPHGRLAVSNSSASGTATGCSIVGFNDDSFETIQITAVSGSTLTAIFAHPHAASDLWGEVAVSFVPNTFSLHEIKDVSINQPYGMGLYLDNMAVYNIENVSVTALGGQMTSGAMEEDGAWWGNLKNLNLVPIGYWGCTSNCSVSYPYGLRCSQDAQANNGLGCYQTTMSGENTIFGGIKLDGNGKQWNQGAEAAIPVISGQLAVEQPAGSAITIDPRNGEQGLGVEIDAESIALSDYVGTLISGTDSCVTGSAKIVSYIGPATPLTNPYYCGTLNVGTPSPQTATSQNPATLPTGRGVPIGVLNDGTALESEVRGEQAGLGPQVVPFATLSVTNPLTCATCSTVLGPDGTSSALEVQTTSAGATAYVAAGNVSVSTYSGDWLLFWSWVRPGTNNAQESSSTYGANDSFIVVNYGTDTWSGGASTVLYPSSFGMYFQGDWWHPQVALAQVVTGDATAHALQLRLNSPASGDSVGNDFWNWGWTLIPGPNNPAYNGVTEAEVERWREQLLHGAVPQNFNSPGVAVTTETVAAPQFDILNPSTGAVAQIAAANLSNGTTGSGSVVLASSPALTAPTVSGTLSVTGTQTLTGATTMQANVTLENGANSNQTLAIQPGANADQTGAVQFNNYSGTSQWQLRKDASNYLRLTDAVNSLDRGVFYQNGNTIINAGAGANAVAINNTSGSGTSGFTVYEGGSNYSTAAFQVGGSGNTTATGFLQGKFMIGTGTMTLAAGAAAGTSPSIACATSHVCDGVSGTVTLTTGTSPTTGTLATLTFPNTHTNQANCIVTTESASAVISSNTWTESTTAITITANITLAASTAYTLKYWCGGN